MKKLMALCIVFATMCFAGCSNTDTGNETINHEKQTTAPNIQANATTEISEGVVLINGNEVLVQTGISLFREGETYPGTYDKAAIPNEVVAVNVAQQIFNGIEKPEEMSYHVPISVFFDNENAVWVITFNEPIDPETETINVGGGYSIALRKTDGAVLRIWLNE